MQQSSMNNIPSYQMYSEYNNTNNNNKEEEGNSYFKFFSNLKDSIFYKNDNEILVEITEVIDDNTFKVNEELKHEKNT